MGKGRVVEKVLFLALCVGSFVAGWKLAMALDTSAIFRDIFDD